MTKLIGFLRGINVGGRHKVPMAKLREELKKLGLLDPRILLNSGNFVVETNETASVSGLAEKIEMHLSQSFGFAIPVILKTSNEIETLVEQDPFAAVTVHKDLRLYASFLKEEPSIALDLPYYSDDKSYKIISLKNKTILSVLDLSISNTTKAMKDLETLFGKNLTTRNWNTISKIVAI
jgi:uncharacterized protein (DUF1697 family)